MYANFWLVAFSGLEVNSSTTGAGSSGASSRGSSSSGRHSDLINQLSDSSELRHYNVTSEVEYWLGDYSYYLSPPPPHLWTVNITLIQFPEKGTCTHLCFNIIHCDNSISWKCEDEDIHHLRFVFPSCGMTTGQRAMILFTRWLKPRLACVTDRAGPSGKQGRTSTSILCQSLLTVSG